jgi:AraC family transcriptional regulator
MTAIAKTIWLIETHFGVPLSLDEMADQAGVSRTHLSRIFPLATGHSISGYIRARRLTEAAKALVAGAPDILDVALDAGYGSHEAFTRAFRDQFGLTPADLRKRRSLNHLNLVEPLPMDTTTKVKLAPPRIEPMPARKFAGLMQRHDMNQSNSIPAQWQKLQPYLGNIHGAVPGAAYGIVTEGDGNFCTYLCGVEITPAAELPPEFVAITVPARRWARITHSGHISTIRSTIQAIYDDWLPGSGQTQAPDISFVEYYGPDFNPVSGLGTCEIWIGLSD